jgi:tRNA(adenine34) deaminase
LRRARPRTVEQSPSEQFMRAALNQARLAAAAGEVPVGAVIEIGDVAIAAAHNRPIALGDPTAHAELLAIREAARALGNYRLPGATLYATVEPCIMCCGAIINARLERLVYGAADPKAGGVESRHRLLADRRLNHQVEVRGGVLARESAELLQAFFRTRRV